MNHRKHSLWGMGALVLLTGAMLLGTQVYAQQQPDQDPSQPSAQQPDQTPPQQTPTQQDPSTQQPPSQPPDQAGQSSTGMAGQAADEQVFSGTIVKSGNKYVLQDAAGKNYDLDHQDMLKEHEGKQVRFKGTLDPDGKTIHIK